MTYIQKIRKLYHLSDPMVLRIKHLLIAREVARLRRVKKCGDGNIPEPEK
jgi:hypothetical protein